MTDTIKPSATRIATKWAFIGLAITIVLTYAFELLDIDPNSAAKYINYIPFIALLLLTQKEYRDELGGYMTFGQGFSAGFRYALFSGLLSALFTYIYLGFLSPDQWTKAMEVAQAQMEEKGTMTDEQVKVAMDFTNKYGMIMTVFAIAVGSAIMGAILSLIGAAIFKKERSIYDNDQEVIEQQPAE
ncbi:hypothetical protein DJ568_04990 [Mucilaginibacter hurinus]|uniref:DUF4199 domain-containing protein n=1 Tax=Mucilaginibacter hurinus TaxID=2201324 RepID=A0A367GTR8_9SPHI|nr:DUF4199 domain-containing protein [Mucilaginibacter hurinus]RCH56103.1 hypothetical protein DJ568_04990 [Mucilaginibacter hurinus]